MQVLEARIRKFNSLSNAGVVPIKAAPGHFATSHSHSNYYIDLTTLKSRSSESKQAANVLASFYQNDTVIDTIVCIDGTMVLGAYLADALAEKGLPNNNQHNTIYVIEPERTNSSQLIFRDNIIPMVAGKNILLLLATISSGISFTKGIRCVEYYGGKVTGISSIFSAVSLYHRLPIHTIYSPEDIPDYKVYDPIDCPMCKDGQKVEAFINAYGYSQIIQPR